MENGKPKDVPIKQGEIFLLPPHVHHSPQRFENTAGFVIERKRDPQERDGFVWYCDHCHHQLHREEVPLKSIVTDLPPLFKRFWDSQEYRTCKKCGQVLAPPAKK
jgi:3-hydroxyanthranilate 3,4-dioxygenase